MALHLSKVIHITNNATTRRPVTINQKMHHIWPWPEQDTFITWLHYQSSFLATYIAPIQLIAPYYYWSTSQWPLPPWGHQNLWKQELSEYWVTISPHEGMVIGDHALGEGRDWNGWLTVEKGWWICKWILNFHCEVRRFTSLIKRRIYHIRQLTL